MARVKCISTGELEMGGEAEKTAIDFVVGKFPRQDPPANGEDAPLRFPKADRTCQFPLNLHRARIVQCCTICKLVPAKDLQPAPHQSEFEPAKQ